MLISNMEAANELVCITAYTGSDADIAVVVPSTHHTGLVGDTHAPSTIVFPERIRADMTTGLAFVPFDVAIDKVLPRIVIPGLMLPRKGGIKAILIEGTHAQADTVTVGLGKGRYRQKDAIIDKSIFFMAYSSFSNTELNESA